MGNQNPLLFPVLANATALMESIRALQPDLPSGVHLSVHVNVSDYEPGVKLTLHAANASPSAVKWLQEQCPDAEATEPYGRGRGGRQVHAKAALSANLELTAYQAGVKAKGGKKR